MICSFDCAVQAAHGLHAIADQRHVDDAVADAVGKGFHE
jgi:hypothetical protein